MTGCARCERLLSQLACRLEFFHQPLELHFRHVCQSVDGVGFLGLFRAGLLLLHVGRDFAHGQAAGLEDTRIC